MMMADNRHFPGEVAEVLHDLLADYRVGFYNFLLCRGKGFSLEQNGVTNADSTDIVEKTRYGHNILLFLATSHLGGKGSAIVADTLRMRSRVWISSFQGCHQRLERVKEAL